MSEINPTSVADSTPDQTLADHDVAVNGVSESDEQAFLQMLQGGGPSESELMKRFEKNFQTMSYQYMKQIFSHVEDQIRRG